MDVERLLEEETIETSTVEIKHENVSNKKLVKEIVAFSNKGGGSVLVGIAEGDDGPVVTGVTNPKNLEEEVSQTLSRHVSPRLEPEMEIHQVKGEYVVEFRARGDSIVRSYGIDPPRFPIRQGSTTTYLDGTDLRHRYSTYSEEQPTEEPQTDADSKLELKQLPSQQHWHDHGPHYIPKSQGHIADICTFGELYLPRDPVRVTATGHRPDFQTFEHSLSCLAETFALQDIQGHFTINQENAAWVGAGLSNFLDAIKSQEERYEEANLHPGSPYKCEEALFVANPDLPYSGSLLVIYAEPWVSDDFCRHFEVVLLTDGHPIDTRPIIELDDESNLNFGTAESITVSSSRLARPETMPVQHIEEVRGQTSDPVGEDNEIIGYLLENPFEGDEEAISRRLDSGVSTPLSEFSHLYAHFLQLPPADFDEPEPAHFQVYDYDEFANLSLDAVHVDFQLDW